MEQGLKSPFCAPHALLVYQRYCELMSYALSAQILSWLRVVLLLSVHLNSEAL